MKNEVTYIENNISKLFFELEQLQQKIYYHQLAEQEQNFNKTPPPDWLIEEDAQLTLSHESMVKSLHNQILCYLDMKKLNSYLDIFIKRFGEFPNTDDAYNGIDFEPFNGEIYNTYLHDIWSFLSPFNFFKNDLNAKKCGISYIENILKNTASIIYKMGTKPTTETEVYNAVKIIIESVFPSSKKAGSNFIKTAKKYNPDILIPELETAIEYKYADNENKLKNAIEQIAADAKGYTGDSEYNLFYAVFYVTDDFWGIEKFKKAWQDNEFPKNWKAFYIVGSNT